jgi:hypothetical protein
LSTITTRPLLSLCSRKSDLQVIIVGRRETSRLARVLLLLLFLTFTDDRVAAAGPSRRSRVRSASVPVPNAAAKLVIHSDINVCSCSLTTLRAMGSVVRGNQY